MGDSKQVQPAAYRLLAADELGVLRVVEVPAGPKWDSIAQVQKWGDANKERAISSIACSSSDLSPGAPALFAVGRKGRCVDILDAQTGQQQASITAAAPAGAANSSSSAGSSQVYVAAVRFVSAAVDGQLQLVAATSDGMISICSCSSSSHADSSSSGSSGGWAITRSFQAGGSVLCMDLDSESTHLLVGGEGVQPSIWDLAAGTKLWQAKGGKPNRQTLLVDKPFTTAVAFLPSSSSSSALQRAAAAGGEAAAAVQRRFVAGSANAKIQVYDTAVGRRPQSEVVLGGETRVTALAPEAAGTRVWAANGMGSIQLLDLQTNKLMDALKGAGGSVRSLALHPSEESLVASVGLDRFLRVHNTSTKASLGRLYLKQQLTGVCWLPVRQVAAATGAEQAAEGTVAGEQQEAVAAEDGEQQQQQQQRNKKKKKKAKSREDVADGDAAADAAVSKKRRKKPKEA